MPGLACLQAVTGSFIAENTFRSLIGRNLGLLRRVLPGTRRASAKIEEGGRGGGGVPSLFSCLPPLSHGVSFCQLLLAPLLRVTKMAATKILAEEKLQRLQLGYARSLVKHYLILHFLAQHPP